MGGGIGIGIGISALIWGKGLIIEDCTWIGRGSQGLSASHEGRTGSAGYRD